MRKEERLTKRKQFAAVYRHGGSWANSLIVLRALPNGLDLNRYGFLISKRVGKAVVRNQVKRRLREAARLIPTQPGWDLVIIARSQASKANYHQLKGALEELLSHGRLLRSEPPLMAIARIGSEEP